jgi:hypothetical protein
VHNDVPEVSRVTGEVPNFLIKKFWRDSLRSPGCPRDEAQKGWLVGPHGLATAGAQAPLGQPHPLLWRLRRES